MRIVAWDTGLDRGKLVVIVLDKDGEPKVEKVFQNDARGELEVLEIIQDLLLDD